jgi:hypothetical protein
MSVAIELVSKSPLMLTRPEAVPSECPDAQVVIARTPDKELVTSRVIMVFWKITGRGRRTSPAAERFADGLLRHTQRRSQRGSYA